MEVLCLYFIAFNGKFARSLIGVFAVAAAFLACLLHYFLYFFCEFETRRNGSWLHLWQIQVSVTSLHYKMGYNGIYSTHKWFVRRFLNANEQKQRPTTIATSAGRYQQHTNVHMYICMYVHINML